MPAGAIFNHETVQLDGESFADCRFENCEWKQEDAAAHTLAYLKVIWSVGAKAPVQALIKEITGAQR